MALGISRQALSHPEINLFVAIFGSYGDDGKLFFDCKKRLHKRIWGQKLFLAVGISSSWKGHFTFVVDG